MEDQEPQEAPDTPDTPELSDVEKEAMSQGWDPDRSKFESNPANAGKKWRSAELFLELTPLFAKIDDLHRQNKNLERGLKAFSEHNAKIETLAFEKAKKELQEQRKAALEEEDFKRAEKLRDELDALKEEHAEKQATTPAAQNGPPTEFVSWVQENPWYNTDSELREEADTYGAGLASRGLPPAEVLKMVSKKMRDLFPNKFRNPNKDSAVSLESSGKKGGEKPDAFKLTAEEETVMKSLLRAKVPSVLDPKKLMTAEEYKAQIKKMRG